MVAIENIAREVMSANATTINWQAKICSSYQAIATIYLLLPVPMKALLLLSNTALLDS